MSLCIEYLRRCWCLSRGAGSEAALAPPQALAAAVLPAPKSLTADSLSAGAWAEEPGLAGSAAPTSSAPHANEQNLLDVPIGQVKLPRQLPLEEGVQEAQSIRCFILGRLQLCMPLACMRVCSRGGLLPGGCVSAVHTCQRCACIHSLLPAEVLGELRERA